MRRPLSTNPRPRLALCAALLCWSSFVHATEPSPGAAPGPSLWREEWPEFSLLEAVFTVSAGVGTLVLYLVGPAQEPRWVGGVLFDDAARDVMRPNDEARRNRIGAAGDITYYAAPIIPFVVDTFLVSYVARNDAKLARNLGLVSLEGFAYSGFLSFVSTHLTARERPEATQCLADHPGGADACDLDSRTESFWSGHTTITATAAGLVCANHSYIPLWGSPAADAFACGLATAGAVTTGITRIVADAHYATDVLAATAVGFGIGFAVPTLLHYTAGNRRTHTVVAAPVASPDHGGIAVSGSF